MLKLEKESQWKGEREGWKGEGGREKEREREEKGGEGEKRGGEGKKREERDRNGARERGKRGMKLFSAPYQSTKADKALTFALTRMMPENQEQRGSVLVTPRLAQGSL